MNIASLFIRRPVMTGLVMFSILLFGGVAYFSLPVSDLPNVDFPTIQVIAAYPGASPETMAAAVATPLEKEFATIAGVDSMNSSSSQGNTSITLQFVLTRNIDAAAQDVQAAIARAAKKLPQDIPAPPSYRKTNPADQPILWLTLTSPNQPMSALDEFGQTDLAQRISMVDGVSQVNVLGSQKYAVRIRLDPHAMAARGIGIDEVQNAVERQNVNLPLGNLNGAFTSATIQANGQLTQANQYAPLVVAYRNGKPVRLRDIGSASDSVENDKVAAWYYNGQVRHRAIVLSIQRQPGTNTVQVADAIKALMPSLREKLPANVALEILRDSSIPIKESARDVQFTLLLTLGLVVLVIFLFLRNLSATVIPSMVLPMSVIGTFSIMYLLDYSLDNLSLMALTLSVGFVVDDAIVMLENVVRHMEMGKNRWQASLDGAKEIGFTIVSMTLSLAAVFIPVLFMGGLVGRLFREFAVTIGAAVLVSGFVSLTLTPMLCSRFLKDQHRVHRGLMYRFTEWGFNLSVRFYGWSLRKVLKHRRLAMLFSLAVLGWTVYLYMEIPKGFLPAEDRSQMRIRTDAAEDISWESLQEHQMAMARVVESNPNVQSYITSCGAGSGGGSGLSNNGSFFIVLKPRNQRTLNTEGVIDELRPKIMQIPGVRAYLTNPPTINIGALHSKAQYQLTFVSPGTTDLYSYADDIEKRMREIPELQDVNSDMQLRNRNLNVVMDRDKAMSYGVSPMQIEEALYTAYGTRQISTILAPNNQYYVIMEVEPAFQRDPAMLSMIYIRSSKGNLVALNSVTTRSEGVGPMSVNHSGQLPSVTISFNVKPGVSLGQAIEKISEITETTMPAGMTKTFQGTAQAFQDSLTSMGWLLVLAVVVIYIVLGILYESLYHPITILSALPFAGAGALITLKYFNVELSLYAFVGIVMLVGLVKKNGIMMVDFAIQAQRAEGRSPHDAIHEACLIRFRPIMMTTMAALMAGIPIALGYGAGAESRQPLGLAVVGGLLFSQMLTLYITPVFYVYMEKLRALLHRNPPPLPAQEQQRQPAEAAK